jgi:hypothetical protein
MHATSLVEMLKTIQPSFRDLKVEGEEDKLKENLTVRIRAKTPDGKIIWPHNVELAPSAHFSD